MALYKSHCLDHAEDFGLFSFENKTIHLYEGGVKKYSEKLMLSPVNRVNALWVEKALKVKCELADTLDKKRLGLQAHKELGPDTGMYFPYEPFSKVAFHQGSVPFSLDLIFMCESQIVQTEEFTKVGGNERWECAECDGVIEVAGGWCQANAVEIGDRICLAAVSEQDLEELEKQQEDDFREADKIGWLVALSETL